MKSFTELNAYSNTSVSYNSQLQYNITWTASAGNISTSEYEGSSFLVPEQIELVTATGITRDILVTILPSSMAAVAFVDYTGSDANISVVTDNIRSWTTLGIQTVGQYSDVFANLYVGITPSYLSEFSFLVSLDDQMGDELQEWTVSVTPLFSDVFVAPELITFTEDQNTSVANIQITEDFLYATNYTITITPESPSYAQIAFAPGNVAANTWSTTASKASINSQLANLVFVPRADFQGNTYFDTSVVRTYGNTTTGKSTLANCAVAHADYSAPSGYAWSENGITYIGLNSSPNLAITDLAVGKSYTSNVQLTTTAIGNLYVSGVGSGNLVSFSGSKTQVNANLALVTFIGNASNTISGNIQYVQTQTTDSIIQGNITIPLTYQIPAIHIYSNVAKSFGTRLNSTGGYDSGTATANVDFWAYQYQTVTNSGDGLPTGYSYSYPVTANVSLSTFRTTSSYRYGPLGINIKDRYGIRSRLDSTRTPGTAGYLGFWLRMNKNHPYANYARVHFLSDQSSTPYPLTLVSWDNSLYWSYAPVRSAAALSNNFWNSRIILGANPTPGDWSHFAIQISAGTTGPAGTQVVSAWRDGVPITDIYGAGGGASVLGPLQTGVTWEGKNYMQAISGFTVGSPLGGPTPLTGSNGFSEPNNPWLDIVVDDIVIDRVARQTDLVAFTPVAGTWGGTVSQLVTGI